MARNNDPRPFCKGKSYHDRIGWVECSNRAVRDGYCGTHHPDAAARRDKKRAERYAEETAIREARWRERESDRRKAARYDRAAALLRRLVNTCRDTETSRVLVDAVKVIAADAEKLLGTNRRRKQ